MLAGSHRSTTQEIELLLIEQRTFVLIGQRTDAFKHVSKRRNSYDMSRSIAPQTSLRRRGAVPGEHGRPAIQEFLV
jgi:hypothetical protein